MRTRFTSIFIILALSVISVWGAQDGRIRILGIGNSFTKNATHYLPAIISSNPDIEADVAVAGIGGSSLAYTSV